MATTIQASDLSAQGLTSMAELFDSVTNTPVPAAVTWTSFTFDGNDVTIEHSGGTTSLTLTTDAAWEAAHRTAVGLPPAGALSIPNYVFVNTKADLPTPVGGVITLQDYYTYFFTGTVDLTGDRLLAGQNCVILGPSSENAYITSTGLGAGVPLLTSYWTIPVRHVTFSDVDTALYIDGTTNPPVALDWTGVNFLNVPNIGEIATCDNFIFSKGAFLSSQGLVFSGTVGTIGIDNSIFVGTGGSGSIIEIAPTCTVTRRFRTIYSAFVVFGATTGIDVDSAATIPVESFILDTCNFSAGGTMLPDVDHLSNTTRFSNCKGVTNTSVNGQLYMNGNATATTISAKDTFVKVAGTTTASADNAKFSHTDNRLTCEAEVERKFLIQCNLSFTSGANNVCEFGFFDSSLGTVRTPSRTKGTAGSGGKAENISFMCVTTLNAPSDYIEIWAANTSSTTDITVTDMNLVVTELV